MSSEASAVGGGVFGSTGALIQGQAQSDALDRAAKIQRQNSSLELQTGDYNANRLTQFANQKIAAGETGYAASGVTADSGSALAVLAMGHANAEMDKQNILHGATVRSINYNNQASMDEMGAKSALQAGYFNAISAVFQGGSKAFGQGSGVNSKYSSPETDEGTYGGAEEAGGDAAEAGGAEEEAAFL